MLLLIVFHLLLFKFDLFFRMVIYSNNTEIVCMVSKRYDQPVISLTTYVMVLLLKFPSGKTKIMSGSTGIIKVHSGSPFLILTTK